MRRLQHVVPGEIVKAMSAVRRGIAQARDRMAPATGPLVLAACLMAMLGSPYAQEQGLAPAKDTIFARKILMGSIDRNMDILETMTTSGNLDLAEGREHADLISIMLMAFPHMFPPGTNQWKAKVDRDPGTDTYASPDVWTNFADFYQRAASASKIAFEASHTKMAEEFKFHVSQLRKACDSCHAAYQKTD